VALSKREGKPVTLSVDLKPDQGEEHTIPDLLHLEHNGCLLGCDVTLVWQRCSVLQLQNGGHFYSAVPPAQIEMNGDFYVTRF